MADPRHLAILDGNLVSPNTTFAINSFYTAGTEAPLMPVTAMLTDEPSERSRLLTHDPYDTYWQFYFVGILGENALQAYGFGIPNVNLSKFGHYRFVADPGAFLLGYDLHNAWIKRLAPDSRLAATNLSAGGVGTSESPRSPDGVWSAPTTPYTEWSARWSFPTPSGSLSQGVYKQAFVLWVRRSSSTVVPPQLPVVNVQLYEGGVFKADLGTKVVYSGSGQTLIFRWDASLLSALSGANVEIFVRASGESAYRVGVDIGAIGWDYELASGQPTHDSGWLISPFDAASSSKGPEATKNLHFLPTSPWSICGFFCLLSDDQADNSYSYSSTRSVPFYQVRPPDGFAQAGVAVAAEVVLTPALVNFAKGSLVNVRDTSIVSYTLGGQEFGSRRRPRRAMPVNLPLLTKAEGYAIFDRLDWLGGKKSPKLVVKYPDGDSDEKRHTSLWCTLEDMPGLSLPSAHNRLSWSGTFVEKL